MAEDENERKVAGSATGGRERALSEYEMAMKSREEASYYDRSAAIRKASEDSALEVIVWGEG